jgi:hypothetical protein
MTAVVSATSTRQTAAGGPPARRPEITGTDHIESGIGVPVTGLLA